MLQEVEAGRAPTRTTTRSGVKFLHDLCDRVLTTIPSLARLDG